MTSLRAHVVGGRFVVDEATDLPEGTEVELTLVSADLDPLEVARVHQALDEALADLHAGDEGVDALAFVSALRAR